VKNTGKTLYQIQGFPYELALKLITSLQYQYRVLNLGEIEQKEKNILN